jgi:hypothetical protein
MATDYTLLIRDARTLALLGEIPVYQFATWKRRDVEEGEFQLNIQAEAIDADLVARNRVLEVRRNGDDEFTGIIRWREYNAITRAWELSGPDLKWWTANRLVVPPAGQGYDSVSAIPAETAMLGYVQRHLTAPTALSRDVNGELDGITFDTAGTAGRGANVTFNARFLNLLSGCLRPLATAGGLYHDVVLRDDYSGYRYVVLAPTDATVATGAVPVVFAVGWDTVGELAYTEDALNLSNAVYVLGQGTEDARQVELVESSLSIASDFRRERAADSRNNATTAALIQDGETVIAQSLAQITQVHAAPLAVGPARYREDLGYEVTLAIPEIGIELDRRIVEVGVTLNEDDGEIVTVQLGSLARTQARIVSEALSRNNRVQVE